MAFAYSVSTGCHKSVALGRPFQTIPPISDTTSLNLSTILSTKIVTKKDEMRFSTSKVKPI